ncbi:hypothetical protein [Streptacidiphilus monticola]|uniref:DNA-binding protein n=1 Tax=Streptacidiphilus monticola TaxID=2161674 RepID=A0ABW1G7Q4_9ACTN
MGKPMRAAIGDRWVSCGFCGNDTFREREVKLNSSGTELLGLGWANESATGLICWDCGFVQLFANDVSLYRA